MKIQYIFEKVAAQFPVIGPHADIEAELMLSGKKPLTWVSVFPDDLDLSKSEWHKEHEGRKKMDKAVKLGRLKSCDVVISAGWPEPWISRHYCQPSKEDDMRLLAAYNTQALNGKEPDIKLAKDIGRYLGYRRRDVLLWSHILPHMPKPISTLIYRFNVNFGQPAYQKQLLQRINHRPAPN